MLGANIKTRQRTSHFMDYHITILVLETQECDRNITIKKFRRAFFWSKNDETLKKEKPIQIFVSKLRHCRGSLPSAHIIGCMKNFILYLY